MTHDLGLGLRHDDDEYPEGRRRPRRRRHYRWLGILVLLAGAVGIVAGAAVGLEALVHALKPAPNDYSGQGYGTVLVQVQPGDSLTDIADVLATDGVVRTAQAFDTAASVDSRALGIQPGYYRMHHHMKATAALALLLSNNARVTSKVVVIEGATLTQLVTAVAQGTHLPAAALRAAAAHPAGLGLPPECDNSVAGCLFPATYLFPPHVTARTVLATMVTRFQQEATAIDLLGIAKRTHRNPHDVITIASILEREVSRTGDYAKVAEVIDNRLAHGMRLQLDSTAAYAAAVGKPAYDTYTHGGLPPGPISFPGTLALQAALHPAHGPYLFFVTIDRAGHTAFAKTFAGQQANINVARRNGVFKH